MLTKCCFVLKLMFWISIVSVLKPLEINCLLEVFHVPSFSGQRCSQELLAETLKVAGLARTLLIIYYETLQYVVFTYYKPGEITQKFIS